MPSFGLRESGPSLDLSSVFSTQRICVEIGSGNGDLASAFVRDHSDVGVIAIDVHRPGIARLLGDVDEHGWTNLRVVEGDALVFLERLDDAVVDEVWAFFPDPWPKNAQAHRRLITGERLPSIARVLKPGGQIRVATDVPLYAAQMRRVLAADERFGPVVTERPSWRIETRFERDGRAAGRVAVDLSAKRL